MLLLACFWGAAAACPDAAAASLTARSVAGRPCQKRACTAAMRRCQPLLMLLVPASSYSEWELTSPTG